MPLGKRSDLGDARYAGLDIPFTSEIEDVLEASMDCGFDFVVAPLADPARRPPPREPTATGALVPPFLPHQVLHTMSSVHISNQIVGRVSAWIDCDAADADLRAASLAALEQELAWAGHLTAQAVLLPPPPHGSRSPNYARAIAAATANANASAALWLLVPAFLATTPQDSADQDDNKALNPKDDPWEWWNAVRFAAGHPPKLGVALEVGAALPGDANLARWWGEPLKAVFLRTDAFLTNRRGYPALPKRHQEFLAAAFKAGVQVVLTGDALHSSGQEAAAGSQQQPLPPPPGMPAAPPSDFPSLAEASALQTAAAAAPPGSTHPMRVYWEYLSFLFRRQPAATEQDALEAPYRDFLQAPLQPLQDNLESQTYETFEKDATKYKVYGEAVRRALLDRVSDADAATAVTVLMVVGAGRGPLVAASLAAAAASGRRLRVWAVEKNPNAVVHLHARAAAEAWGDRVTIVHADMRDWRAPEPADILVSELLGSFGDNELSPECLDGAQRFLAPGGISIPASYTSYLQPVTAHKLWTDAAAYDDLEHFETPFVVKLHRVTPLAPSQRLFTFTHPNPSAFPDNTRDGTLEFKTQVPAGAVCHGFAGYFDAELYADVALSIHPETHTPDMASWFPIYFPVRQPFYVPAGGEVQVSVWRRCSRQRVWYEWGVDAPVAGPLHNPNGRSYYVGL